MSNETRKLLGFIHTKSEQEKIVKTLAELNAVLGIRWNNIKEIIVENPIIFNNTIINKLDDIDIISMTNHGLEENNLSFIDNSDFPAIQKSGRFIYNSEEYLKRKDIIEVSKNCLSQVFEENDCGWLASDNYCDNNWVSSASKEDLYYTSRLAMRMVLDPRLIKQVPYKFYLKIFFILFVTRPICVINYVIKKMFLTLKREIKKYIFFMN